MPQQVELPADLDAEQAVLGSILIDRNALTAVSHLKPEDFFLPVNAEIYRTILDLSEAGKPPDTVLLANALQDRGRLDDVGGVAYLAALSALVPTSINAPSYAEIVTKHSILRQLIDAGTTVSNLGWDRSLDADTALGKAMALLESIGKARAGNEHKDMATLLASVRDNLLAPASPDDHGVLFGFPDSIEELTGGFKPNDLWLLAARPSVGKTSLVCTIALNVAVKLREPVLFLTLEMPDYRIVEKLMAIGLSMDWKKLHSHDFLPSEAAGVSGMHDKILGSPFVVENAHGWTISKIRSFVRKYGEPKLVIVDYLQKIQADTTEHRVQQIREISGGLKDMAVEMKCSVLALTQLRRIEGTVPDLKDLREGGDQEQDADLVLALHRESEDRDAILQPVSKVFCDVLKNRLGAVGRVPLAFMGPQMRFTDWAGEVIEPVPSNVRYFTHPHKPQKDDGHATTTEDDQDEPEDIPF